MTKQNDAEVASLIEQIKFDNNNNLKYLPFGEDILSLILECGLQEGDELRKLFKNSAKKQWDLFTKTKNGKKLCEEYKDYNYLFLFELCRGNYDISYSGKTEHLEHIFEILCQFMGNMAKKIVKDAISWHINNSKNNTDLIKFLLDDINFIKKCPRLIEYMTPNIWKILDEKEKPEFSFLLLYNFVDKLDSLSDINLKNELEKYFDNYMMELVNIKSRNQKMYNGFFEENTQTFIIGKINYGILEKNEAVNKFVSRKIGYPLFIKDDIGDEDFIDYIINVELNKNFQLDELKEIDVETYADFIWKIICTQKYDYKINEKAKNVFLKRDDLVETIENAKIHFSENFKDKHIGIDKKIELLFFIKTEKAFYKALEMLSKISNDIDIFSMLRYLNFGGYETVLIESRKLQINKLLKKGTLQQEEADKLIAMAENKETSNYVWSDDEIKRCLLPETDLEKLHTNLEPELMVRIFELSVLLVIKCKPSRQIDINDINWQCQFVMRIFNKSYADRPSIWAKHLIKIADEWKGSENMLLRICFALGHLREPLGGQVPISLQKIADKQENNSIKKSILTQRNLFNRENFNKGHHKNPFKRVELCKEELIEGINNKVEEKNLPKP